MKFPTLLYKVPGPHGPKPGYKYTGCADEAQFKELTAQGWAVSKAAAQGKEKAEEAIEIAEELAEAVDDIEEPTRDELEAKAKELGVSFNWKTSDEVLIKRIAEKLG